MKIRPARAALVAVAIVTVGVIAVATAFSVAYVAQPGCVSCHDSNEEFAQATAASSHAEAACTDCHGQSGPTARARFAGRQVFGMWTRVSDSAGRYASAVPRSACLSCHQEVLDGLTEANGYRIEHAKCAQGAQCTDCHSGTAHGAQVSWARESDMQACIACHERERKSTKCESCHVGKNDSVRLTEGIWRVTHGPNWRKAHGMGDSATCGTCHPKGYCDRCHGPGVPHDLAFMNAHGTISQQPAAKCEGCHERKFCDDCHGVDIPHRPQFVRTHSKDAKGVEDPACTRCHSIRDCRGCHDRHAHPGGVGPKGSTSKIRGVTPPGSTSTTGGAN